MFSLVSKLKALKLALKKWNVTDQVSIKMKHKLTQAQTKLSTNPFDSQIQHEESQVKVQLETWLDREEEQIRDKSRELWRLHGDRNTKLLL